MNSVSFRIEEKNIFVDTSLLNERSFTIRSIPRPYAVEFVTSGSPRDIILNLFNENSKNLLLIDRNIKQLYLKDVELPTKRVFVADATEEFKTINGVLDTVGFLERNQFTKGEKLIVVGGGIIEDVGAFVAAIFKRGIRWVYFPTTLLSQCDSCIGGKTGINHNGAKNQLALFSAPQRVIIHMEFLRTLGEKEIRSGLGEILRLSITGGEYFINAYEQNVKAALSDRNLQTLQSLIKLALLVKKSIVEEDEFELDLRRSLNYGHTIGHAVESLSNFEIPHGIAVSVGMSFVNELGFRRSLLIPKAHLRMKPLLEELLDSYSKGVLNNIPYQKIGEIILKDKKVVGSKITLIVVNEIGNMRFIPIVVDEKLSCDIQNIAHSLYSN